jgi:hypothetical protein
MKLWMVEEVSWDYKYHSLIFFDDALAFKLTSPPIDIGRFHCNAELFRFLRKKLF